MRILFLTPYLPYPPAGGGRIRIYSLLQELAVRHEVHLLAFRWSADDDQAAEKMRAVCADVQAIPITARQRRENKRREQLRSLLSRSAYQHTLFYSQAMQAAIDATLHQAEFDLIHVENSQMGYYDLSATIPRVLDMHDVVYKVLQRTYQKERLSIRKLYSWLEWRKFRRDELAICSGFSTCVTVSDYDTSFLAPYLPTTRFTVVPNGVNTRFFTDLGPSTSDDPVLLFTGTMDYYPNTEAVTTFAQQVWPLVRARAPAAQFYIVGKNPSPAVQALAADPSIVVTGYVDDTRDYYRRASVFVAPIRIAGGTRLKILEAMAMGRPVVSTSVGAEGIAVSPGENIVLADEPATFADAVVTLLGDPAGRARLAAAGRRLVEERYDWTALSAQLEQVYTSLLAPTLAPTPTPLSEVYV